MTPIFVEVCSPDRIRIEDWDDLITQAPANVFMAPAALQAVQATAFADIAVLLAWDVNVLPHRLVGLWALQKRRIARFAPALLATPPYNYAFLSSPVVVPSLAGEVMPAFFTAIARSPGLPKLLGLKHLDGDTPVAAAMLQALTARGSSQLQVLEHSRPFVSKEVGAKRSGSTRKKLRQDWNRLAALGTVDVVNRRTPGEVAEAFEVFLAMEAGSWKGAQGTALLSDAKDAAFTRRLVHDLAAGQNASVALLRVNGTAIAAQVVLYCGRTGYTWKTAFDAAFAKYSPGALLVDRVTELLFATDTIDDIESCSPEGGFMSTLWTERRRSVDLLVDVRRRNSLSFAVAVLGGRGYEVLRMLRNKLRALAVWRGRRRRTPVLPA